MSVGFSYMGLMTIGMIILIVVVAVILGRD